MELRDVTPREREVFELLGEHLTHAEIANRLFISVRTVESHVAALRRKLETPDHRALVRIAIGQRADTGRPAAPIPTPMTSFVGREAEISSLVDALRGSRLVSAVGPGGVGKTRLAREAVVRLADAGDLPPRWVDLVPVTDPAGVDGAVAQACGVVNPARSPPVEALIAAFRAQAVLLVLDNGEHVINAVAVLVERLVNECPALTVLITSRLRLAVPFERVIRVDGLSGDEHGDAVRLFAERAAAAGAPPTRVDRVRIGRICEALGGLPLAVELAAARLPALGLDGVERGLADQPRLLGGGRGMPGRHRSMHETLSWSTALLDPATGTALTRAAVFVAPFDADAAVAVIGFAPIDPASVPAALAELVEHNLLATAVRGDRFEYRMLEPVRQFALEQLRAEDATAFARHLAWCCAALAVADGGDPPLDDARAALAWACDQAALPSGADELARVLGARLFDDGQLGEAQRRLEQAASLAGHLPTAVADLARAAAVAKCRVVGEDALRLELAAAERAEQGGVATSAALALGRAAELLNRFPGMFAEGRPPEATPFVERARTLAPADPRVAATLAVAVAGYAGADGAPSRAAAAAAVTAARAVGDLVLESSALDALTAAVIFERRVVEAHDLAQDRVARLRPWGADPATGLELKDALHVAAFCALGAGRLDVAREMAHEQRGLPFLRDRRDLAEDELIAPAALAGDWDLAFATGERFLDDWNSAGRPEAAGRGLAPAAVALAYGLCGDLAARRRWLRILADIRGVPVVEASRGTGYGELFEAMVLLQHGRPGAAVDVLDADPRTGLFSAVFTQWIAAVAAEAAVLAGASDAEERVAVARAAGTGNPIATAIADRAAALVREDSPGLAAIAADFDRLGQSYQAERSRAVASSRTPSQ